jgi:photosystem II stability/assembly factor-like uncharacterized protein
MRLFSSALLIIILISSCKKDLLHLQEIEKIPVKDQADRLNRVIFINDTLGFVVGGQRFLQSTILRTTDGGNSWDYKNIGDASKELFNLELSPGNLLYCVGFDGKILTSSDLGQTWIYHQSWYLPFKDIAFISDKKSIIIGGVSFNAGYKIFLDNNFNASPFDSIGAEMNDIEMVNGKTGFISCYGGILKTTDSGYTWNWLEIENDNFTAIHSVNNNEAWTCGYAGSIFLTTDGGESWERLRNGNDIKKPHYSLLDIRFIDKLHGFAVGEGGLFIYSDDGGNHWMEFEKFTSEALRSIAIRKDGSIFVCGDGGSLYRIKPRYLK